MAYKSEGHIIDSGQVVGIRTFDTYFCIDEMTAETSYDLSQRFNERTDRDGTDGSS